MERKKGKARRQNNEEERNTKNREGRGSKYNREETLKEGAGQRGDPCNLKYNQPISIKKQEPKEQR